MKVFTRSGSALERGLLVDDTNVCRGLVDRRKASGSSFGGRRSRGAGGKPPPVGDHRGWDGSSERYSDKVCWLQELRNNSTVSL